MNENDLFRAFLGGFPDSMHPLDMRRFVAYAFSCAENNHYIDTDGMRSGGVSEESMEVYENAFTWIRETCDYLRSQGRI